MSGFESSSEEDRFKLQTTDFTNININNGPVFCEENDIQSTPLNVTNVSSKNHFYNKLGFEVGNYFSGEKRIYQIKRS